LRDANRLFPVRTDHARHIIKRFVDRDFQKALDDFHDSVSRFPSNIALLSNYRNPLHTIGRTDLTIQLAERIIELDPLSPICNTHNSSRSPFASKMQLRRTRRCESWDQALFRRKARHCLVGWGIRSGRRVGWKNLPASSARKRRVSLRLLPTTGSLRVN
jgi:hypothetical protein